jgi:hypothetical protein
MSTSAAPPPLIPWQITGNHWVALPCIHPADASIHAVGVLHRGARAALEFAGAPDFIEGQGTPLLRPMIEIDSMRQALSASPVAWERALGWIPTFTYTIDGAVVRGTIFAPYGRDADVSGAVYALSIENRAKDTLEATFVLEGHLGHRQLRVQTPVPCAAASRVTNLGDGIIALDGAEMPSLAAMAVAGEPGTEAAVDGLSFTLRRKVTVPKGTTVHVAFYIALGPERDGAVATANVLRRRGWRDLLAGTRDALRMLEQSSGVETIDRLINRNLLFAYFYAVGRALDDAHFYLVRTRVPWHSAGVTVRDWEALMWTIPAVQLADTGLARELLLRTCELHGYAAGRGVQYFDGTLFEPGFSLDGAAAFALAAERYIRDTGDDHIVDDPAIADALYLVADVLASRRDKKVPLFTTEVTPSGEPAVHPFTLHGNAVAAQALDILKRTLDEETSANVEDADAVRAAIKRHFVIDKDEKKQFASSTDLAGNSDVRDDPSGSTLWLPFYETVPREDSTYRRTAKQMELAPERLTQRCARLVGPDSAKVLDWFRRAPLSGGMAAEFVDGEGRATGNAGDASLSGLIAWSAWYAVHALGERP